MKELAKFYKLRLGADVYKELLASGELPPDLMLDANFEENQQNLDRCKKHGTTPSEEQIKSCLTCSILTKRIFPPKQEKRNKKTAHEREKEL